MKLPIKKSTINEILINIFVVISVIFPGDIYSLKKILFFVICLFNIRLIFKSLLKKENNLHAFFGFVFPTILLLYSSLLTSNILVSFTRSFAAYMFLIIFVIKYYDIDYEKILVRSINLIVLMTLLIVTMDLLNIINVNSSGFFRDMMYGYEIGLMGKSPIYPFYYKVFFKTSPLVVIVLFKNFDKGKYIITFLALVTLILSGTRANVLFPIFFLSLFYIFCTGNKSKIIKYTFIFLCASLMIIFSSSILDIFNENIIVKGQISDIVRRGHIEGIRELIQNDPLIIIRGSGMGSSFYSYGSNAFSSSIEWSYIDLWRQMGFLFFSLFIIFITIPIFYHNKSGKYKKYAYISYLFIAGTNPLLFSSTAYLIYIYMYYDLTKIKTISTQY